MMNWQLLEYDGSDSWVDQLEVGYIDVLFCS